MISKTLAAKGFVALSTTSAVGTGAAKFFTTKSLSARANEELVKRLGHLTNREVLERAGFRDSLGDEGAFKDSIVRRLGKGKATAENIEKFKSFCEKGLGIKFSGLHEAYQTLATVCTKAIALKNKVVRENRELSGLDDIQTRLNTISEEKLLRKFFSSLEDITAENVLKVCKEYGLKDVFELGLERSEIADYMTFCANSSVSVLSFWTGVENPTEVAEEKTIRQKLQEEGLEVLNTEGEQDDSKWSNNSILLKGSKFKTDAASQEEINQLKNRCEVLLNRLFFEERKEEYTEAAQKCVAKEEIKGKTIEQKLREAGFNVLDDENNKWMENLTLVKGKEIVSQGVSHDLMDSFKKSCTSLLEKEYSEENKGDYLKAAKECVEVEYLSEKLKRLGLKLMEKTDKEIISKRWNDIVSNEEFINEISDEDLGEGYRMNIQKDAAYTVELAEELVGLCTGYSGVKRFDESTEKRWNNYLLFCAKDGETVKYEEVKGNDFWTNSPIAKVA